MAVHVTIDGDDATATGSAEHPFGSIDVACAAACAGFLECAPVHVHPGTYEFSSTMRMEQKRAVVLGISGASETVLQTSLDAPLIEIVNSELELRGLSLIAAPSDPASPGTADAHVHIAASMSGEVLIRDCVVTGSGIHANSVSQVTVERSVLTNVLIGFTAFSHQAEAACLECYLHNSRCFMCHEDTVRLPRTFGAHLALDEVSWTGGGVNATVLEGGIGISVFRSVVADATGFDMQCQECATANITIVNATFARGDGADVDTGDVPTSPVLSIVAHGTPDMGHGAAVAAVRDSSFVRGGLALHISSMVRFDGAVADCSFADSTSDGTALGGAIGVQLLGVAHPTVSLSRVSVSGCSAPGGGAVAVNAADATSFNAQVSSLYLSGNTATSDSGGALQMLVCASSSASVAFDDVNLSRNTATGDGGGLALRGCSAMPRVQATITQVTAASLSARGGAVVYIENVDAALSFVTAKENFATTTGGGVLYVDAGSASVAHSIFRASTAITAGGDIVVSWLLACQL